MKNSVHEDKSDKLHTGGGELNSSMNGKINERVLDKFHIPEDGEINKDTNLRLPPLASFRLASSA